MPSLNASDNFYIGSSQVDKVYFGSDLLWPPPPLLVGDDWATRVVDTEFVTDGMNGVHDSAGDGVVVTHYNGYSYKSVDGVNWTKHIWTGSLVPNNGSYWTAHNPILDRYVAGGALQKLHYSDDAEAWTLANGQANMYYAAGRWVPWLGEFLAIRQSSSAQTEYFSSDGINWTAGTDVSAYSGIVQNLFVAPDHMICIMGGTAPVHRCDTKSVWTLGTGMNNSSTAYTRAAWCGPWGWRAVRRNAGINIYKSTDKGITWTTDATLPAGSDDWLDIAYDANTDTIIIWRSGEVWYSQDGAATWTQATGTASFTPSAENVRCYEIAYVPSISQFVVVANNKIHVSQ